MPDGRRFTWYTDEKDGKDEHRYASALGAASGRSYVLKGMPPMAAIELIPSKERGTPPFHGFRTTFAASLGSPHSDRAGPKMAEVDASSNRFVFWPLLPGAALTLYFCSFLRSDTFGVEIFGQGMRLIFWGLFALVGLLAALFISIVQAVKAGRRKSWRRAISMAACPILVIAAIPIAVLYDHVEDQIAFRRNLPAFERTVADARDGGEHRAAKVLAIIRQSLQTMVWDDRYRAGLLLTEQTEDWRRDYETCHIIPVKDQIFVTECPLDEARKKDM